MAKIKTNLAPPSKSERIIKPRKPVNQKTRIVVYDSEGKTWWEGENAPTVDWDLIELVNFLRDNWPKDRNGKSHTTPIILVCHNPHKVFLRVHKAFKNDSEYKCKFTVSPGEKYYVTEGASKTPKAQHHSNIKVSFFGFRSKDRKTKYFHLISPFDFMDDFQQYGDPNWPEYIRLYHWAGNLRKWIVKNKLKIASSRGGLSAQLLKDKRFYPNARRKVPKQTNEKARPAMPGNYYAMVQREFGVFYGSVYLIDQQNAHHYAAETVNLPDANTLFAKGRFLSESDEPYAHDTHNIFDTLLDEHGLYKVRLYVPNYLGGILPPWASKSGFVNTYLYSNEIDLCRKLGIEIRHIAYAWTSPDIDVGLKKYSQWAQNQVTQYPTHKTWLKPLLLSAYGILGARPRKLQMAYWGIDKGEPYRYLLGSNAITMQKIETQREIQPVISNTIHRGMIEAETRKLSIELARKLETEGHHVIGLHADAVFVHDTGQQLPLLPAPWRVKDKLTNFYAIDSVSFRSDTVTILPGRKRASR